MAELRFTNEGNTIIVTAGGVGGIIEATIKALEDNPTFRYVEGSGWRSGSCYYECRLDNLLDVIAIEDDQRSEQMEMIDMINSLETVEDIQERALIESIDLDARKKKLSSVKEDFIERYKEKLGDECRV